ncbi:MAG: glycosyltransferase family 2 protein [candidate division KSB1 bacterium]|nr:glycosyltransferase family 2 protein [candidate division KSB1 bacterium]MDZ7276138.1 glycosyltransferase family 2 protein [candidate division KSB1 bacterium]MDZ7287082.1 glycosyltransferase family 2 protein [candidate division KSB1 bacterium]MDZ7296993.1 glycosyltransferase family 2 protein [candidate division KSB1 bacterium]MDZ7306177.1 glycosyltransferase family 2 protein [candidate division KSB1 bacterium]
MTAIWVTVFWLNLALLVYAYAGFPLLVVIMARLQRRRVLQAPITPRLSLIIPVWNEARTIAARLDNALALDYPGSALEIIVVSDGSDDDTEAIVARYADRGVRLLALPRRGKLHAIREAVAGASGELLVFSDANSMYRRDALRMLARNFADPRVGGVCGNQIYLKAGHHADSTNQGEQFYWSFDKWLKQQESLTGSIVSAHGAIYAIRRALYRHPESAAVTDDFAISTAVIEQGYRLVFEREAVAHEEPVPAAAGEFHRKVRIMTRGWRGVLLRRKLLNPRRHGFYAVTLFSHKVMRRLVPVFLLLLFGVSLVLAPRHDFYAAAAWAQALFYALAGLGYALRQQRWGRLKLLALPFFYCLANAAALVALVRVLRGDRIERWQPQRQMTASGVPIA